MSRLLAAASACAAITAVIATPAHAQPPHPAREATAALYAFDGGAGQEAVTIENQDWSRPDWSTGRTNLHPGWSIHFSEERLGAGLPKQDFTASAHQTEAKHIAATKGFISIMDQNDADVPFLVLKLDSQSVTCNFVNVPLSQRLFVRKHDGELREVNLSDTVTAESVTGAHTADDPKTYDITVKINAVDKTTITHYGPFWKYYYRSKVNATGREIVLTQRDHDTGDTKTYRILAGGTAVSCP